MSTDSYQDGVAETAHAIAAQLREAQRIAGIGSWEWQITTGLVTWSEGLHLILGRDPQLGTPAYTMLSRFYTPASWERLRTAIAEAISAGTSYELELEMIRGDETTCWTTTRGEAVRGGAGTIVSLRGTVHDITRRKLAERALEEQAAQLREAQRIAGIGSWEWDVASDVVNWSEGLYLILGRDPSRGGPTYKTLPHFYTPESFDRLAAAVERALTTGASYELELEMIRDDGGTCWTTTRGEAVRCAGGTVIRLRGTVHDITQRKRAEQVQAHRLGSLGMLAAGVAHEINNPLTYVLHNIDSLAHDMPRIASAVTRCRDAVRAHIGEDTYTELIGSDADTLEPAFLEDAVARAEEALSGVTRIKNIATELRTFSRAESTDLHPIDIRQPVDAAINMAHNEIKYRALLVKDYREVPPVLASEGKLAQVFLNLLINATQAIDEGRVDQHRITIRTWRVQNDICTEVSDTGRGIEAEHLPHVFDPFFTTKGVGRGSGLGLAICRNIVTEFGGTISVTSVIGRGTRFLVKLPVAAAAEAPLESSAGNAAAASGPVRGRVLVVDDEPLIRATVSRLLKPYHEVVTAASGAEGREILSRGQSFDVILCDLMMPDLTGMDLHEWLSAENPEFAARVVFVTGAAFTSRASEYLARSGNLRIEKPFNGDELVALVAKLVADRAASHATPTTPR